MSRFGRGNDRNNGGYSRNASGGRSGGGGYSRGNSGGSQRSSGGGFGNKNRKQGNDNGKFARIGSVVVAKGSVEKIGDQIVDELKDSGIQLWIQPFFNKGVNSVTINKDSKILVSLQAVKGAPDFVVGKVSVVVEDQE